VMTDRELDELAAYLQTIHDHFRPLYPATEDFAMDVEFKVTPDRDVVIKQARPLARARSDQ
jgi:hypothetical protein